MNEKKSKGLHRTAVWICAACGAVAVLAALAVMLWPREEDTRNAIEPVNVLNEGVEVPEGELWGPIMSGKYGVQVGLAVDETLFPGKTVTFDVYADEPLVCWYDYWAGNPDMTKQEAHLGNRFTVENGTRIVWTALGTDSFTEFMEIQNLDFYADIVIRADGQIVGFAMIVLDREEPGEQTFRIYMVKNELYPPVDGQIQEVTEAYIERQLKKARNKYIDESQEWSVVLQQRIFLRENHALEAWFGEA